MNAREAEDFFLGDPCVIIGLPAVAAPGEPEVRISLSVIRGAGKTAIIRIRVEGFGEPPLKLSSSVMTATFNISPPGTVELGGFNVESKTEPVVFDSGNIGPIEKFEASEVTVELTATVNARNGSTSATKKETFKIRGP